MSLASRQGNKCPSKNIGPYYRLEGEIYAKKKKKSLLFVLRWKRERKRIYIRTAIEKVRLSMETYSEYGYGNI